MQGYGIMMFKNGEVWKGIFKDNQINGFGIFQLKDKSTIIGKWKNGIFQGKL